MSFEHFGLEAEILRAINEQGYDSPTPIQAKAIPLVRQGHDLMAGAQTGTGKTAGFVLPMLQHLATQPRRGKGKAVRALVLTPTRELAAQVGDSVRDYGRHLRLKSAVIFGGVNIRPQMNKLRDGVDVLVATPGRLLDHAGQGTVDLSQIEIFVLDEADRMLDMGFIHDIRRVISLLPAKDQRQNLLFSATFSADIRKLANTLLTNPQLVEVAGTNRSADTVEQRIHPVDKSRKRELLSHLVGAGNWQQVLVFSRTKHGANRLVKQLTADGLESAAIHGNKSQAARTKALKQFKDGKVRVLVATDIAARGIDIDRLPHVVNFDLPNVPEDYVHRIGRTGRAGREGEAISLVSADEIHLLRDIERLIGRELPRQELDGYEPDHTLPTGPTKSERKAAGKPSNKSGRGKNGGKPRSQARGHGGRDGNGAKPAGKSGRRRGGRSGASNGNGNSNGNRSGGNMKKASTERGNHSGSKPGAGKPQRAKPGRGRVNLADKLFGNE
ncbi:DEAD/DEAH box helicase [Marinihelvus fidelis]|uniref:ATP-dependent RNA helicase RhlE n=1 Tax=Marinihelvus fidelis TaxID=2613842 RepID=A0A5N0T8W9_9GAMM|nr:DEAD/DEAH box helicase [Marinihelvus fidelis]KAA9131483.1 DEAD/DEAH box helicase [Marinihelvus fidelis]